MSTLRSASLQAVLGIILLVAASGARGGNLSVLLCNTANIDLFDCVDLVNLYNATDGDNWFDNSNWGTPDVDSWHGVIVNPINDRVIAIDLAQNGLDGGFPPSMVGLQALEFLQLSGNALRGQLPGYIGGRSALKFLQVGFNGLEGPVPASLGNLTQLDNLFLGGNRFSGSLPASLGNLTLLEVLDIFSDSVDAGGRLTGPLPDLSRLTRLRRLVLDANRLDGPLPDYFDQLPQLQEIRLRGNRFSGTLPANLGSLPNLRILDLAGNQLGGTLPSTLGNLGALEELDLSLNGFTTTLPPALGSLGQLRVLRIAGNPLQPRPQVTGPLPATLANLALLEELDLEFNRLSGALPECLGALASLRRLSLQANDLSGTVPEAFTALNLQQLFIGLNFLDADASNQLLLSPSLRSWLDAIPATVDMIPGFGVIDSREQRPLASDPLRVFADGFEGQAGNACPTA